MKKILYFFLLILIIFIVTCSGPYIGKYYLLSEYTKLESSNGADILILKYIEINYNYFIDQTSNTITLDGFIKIRPQAIGTGSRCEIGNWRMIVLFLDRKGKVIDIKYFDLAPMAGKEIFKPIPFKRKYRYDTFYASVAFSYSGDLACEPIQ